MSKISAMELERYGVHPEDPRVPTEALAFYCLGVAEGIPSAIAYHPEHGWFVLQCGQGPYIAWRENE